MTGRCNWRKKTQQNKLVMHENQISGNIVFLICNKTNSEGSRTHFKASQCHWLYQIRGVLNKDLGDVSVKRNRKGTQHYTWSYIIKLWAHSCSNIKEQRLGSWLKWEQGSSCKSFVWPSFYCDSLPSSG